MPLLQITELYFLTINTLTHLHLAFPSNEDSDTMLVDEADAELLKNWIIKKLESKSDAS